MKRHSLNLHLNFDPDAAGANAAERSIKLLLDENVRVRIVELEGGLDPDEYCKQHGAEAYHQRIAGAKTYFYWLADRARPKFNMREPQGRIDAFQSLVPAIQGLNDKLERVAVANDLASYLGVDPGLVLEHFRKVAADRVERSPAPENRSSRATDRILLPLLVNDAEARAQLIDHSARSSRACGNLARRRSSKLCSQCTTRARPSVSTLFMTRIHPSLQDILAAIVLDAGLPAAPRWKMVWPAWKLCAAKTGKRSCAN